MPSFEEAVVDNADTLIAVLDIHGRIVRFNRTCEAVSGWSAGEVLGRRYWEVLLDPTDAVAAAASYEALFEAPVHHRHDNRWVTRDGRSRVLTWSNTVLHDDDGIVTHLVCTGLDVTERHAAEEELARSERRHRAILEHSSDLVVVLDEQGRLTYTTPAVERLLGRTVAEVLGTSALDHVHPDDREAVASAILGAMSVESPGMPVTLRLVDVHGTPIAVEGAGYNSLDSEAGGVVVSLRDMREREERLEGLTTADLRYRALAVAARDAIVTVDEDGRVWSWNEGARHMLGHAPEDAIGSPLSTILPTGLPEVGEVVDVDAFHRDGHVVPVEVSVSTYEYIGFRYRLAILRDISARRAAEAAARAADRRFRTAFDAAPIGMALVSLDGQLLQANQAMSRILGYEPGDLVGLHYADITHPDDLAADEEAARRMFETGRSMRLEKRYCRSDGDWVWVALSISIVFDENGAPDHVVAQVEDITDRKAVDDVLADQARHDHLTGMLNRHAFDGRLEQAMARRHLGPVTLLFLDLDGFKDVNDSYGHSVGDDVLRVVAARIAETLRPQDLSARIGGDEFVAILEGITGEQAQAVADRLTRSVGDPVAVGDGRWAQVSASVGIATATTEDLDAADVLARADRAMYAVKRARAELV